VDAAAVCPLCDQLKDGKMPAELLPPPPEAAPVRNLDDLASLTSAVEMGEAQAVPASDSGTGTSAVGGSKRASVKKTDN
jgi:hypothetical protein